ncbi:MAG: ribonuclease H-like domain-containing protein [Cyanobium sp.]|nr:ribonuclease H-like domain-containing protein [Cyanobium sp.]
MIGAWWEEIDAQKLFEGERPAVTSLDQPTLDAQQSGSPQNTVPGLNSDVLQRLREQAAIQIKTPPEPERPAFRVRPHDQQAGGLALLPRPDAGDIWFDMEGFPDPISGEKLEYLFGACYRDAAGALQFKAWWAHTPAEEKQAFDGFIQWVMQRRAQHPNLHVYHYASYEKTALGNLAARHQVHQPLWDQWLREELFVDLYPIVRRGLLIGAPSYSIKKVERLYAEARSVEEVHQLSRLCRLVEIGG